MAADLFAVKLFFHRFFYRGKLRRVYLTLGLFKIRDAVARHQKKLIVERAPLAVCYIIELFEQVVADAEVDISLIIHDDTVLSESFTNIIRQKFKFRIENLFRMC